MTENYGEAFVLQLGGDDEQIMHRCVSSPRLCGMQSKGINVPFVGVNHAAADRLELIAKPVFEGEREHRHVFSILALRDVRLRLLQFRFQTRNGSVFVSIPQ
ncbi:uncharacterized [Tachysurus ichikawai]